jgi:predicted adenine nucleotide alpha hydrolase (AANH) superfamily ATPase
VNILVHTCCAPCAFKVVSHLKDMGYIVDLLFYNPNIHPEEEYNKRLEGVKMLADIQSSNLIIDNTYSQKDWEEVNSKRCLFCYEDRIDKLFYYAKKYNYELVTTSLLTSIYQNHELVKNLLIKYSKIYNIDYYYFDFRNYFYESKLLSKNHGIYIQKYCGCIISKNNND